jgi:hypothetical protein
MTASRNPTSIDVATALTACPPRRSCVAGAARRRGQACTARCHQPIAFGAAATAPGFNPIVDDYDTINPVARTPR